MSDGKGKLPTDSSPAEVDEGWDELDEAIAAAVPNPAAPAPPTAPIAAPPASAQAEVLSLKDRHKTDQDHLAVRDEDLLAAEGAEEEWEVGVATAKHLPRDLPLAPPGERRVARTIMGVGTPELQEAIRQRLARSTPEPAAPITRPLTPPDSARPTPAIPVATGGARRPSSPATPTGPASERPRTTPTTLKRERPRVTPTGPGQERPEPAPAAASSQALAETDRVPVVSSGSEEVPPISALASTAPLASVGPPPEVPYAQTAPAIEPHTVRMRPGGAPAVTPTAATRRAQPERRPGQGPSNLALILLWTVALISVGLALYLYFARG